MIKKNLSIPLNLIFGLVFFSIIFFSAIVSIFWTPYDITELEIGLKLKPVGNATFFLGTDHFGRDIISMLMIGARTSITVAIIAILIGVIIGVPIGLIAASKVDSWLDDILMRSNDVVFAFPALVIAILITAVFGPSAFNATLAIGIFNIPVFARVTRGSALSIFTLDYVLSAKVSGKSNFRISLEHILPNLANLLVVQSTIQFSLGILAEASLSYVGLGAQPPIPSWGRMLADSQTMISFAPHLALAPGITIILTVLSVNLMGDGLRDILQHRKN